MEIAQRNKAMMSRWRPRFPAGRVIHRSRIVSSAGCSFGVSEVIFFLVFEGVHVIDPWDSWNSVVFIFMNDMRAVSHS